MVRTRITNVIYSLVYGLWGFGGCLDSQVLTVQFSKVSQKSARCDYISTSIHGPGAEVPLLSGAPYRAPPAEPEDAPRGIYDGPRSLSAPPARTATSPPAEDASITIIIIYIA